MTDGPQSQQRDTINPVVLRTLSAAVLVPVTLGAVWAGGIWFALLILIVGLVAAWEWTRLVHAGGRQLVFLCLYAAAVLASMAAVQFGAYRYAVPIVIVCWLSAMVLCLRGNSGNKFLAAVGVPYICLPVISLISLRLHETYGLWSLVWLLIVIWATDTGAFFAGRALGGPKLATRFSPKKTWSGAIAGLLAAAAAAIVLATMLELPGALALGFFSVLISASGQVGDLFESAVKRRAGVKDSSALIPGHGGVLDRIDSLVVAAPLAWVAGVLRAGYDGAAEGILVW